MPKGGFFMNIKNGLDKGKYWSYTLDIKIIYIKTN